MIHRLTYPMFLSTSACLIVLLISSCDATSTPFNSTNDRGGATPTLWVDNLDGTLDYNYSPSVVYDFSSVLHKQMYRTYWCAGGQPDHIGDTVYYAEGSSMQGPWYTKEGQQWDPLTAQKSFVFQSTHNGDDWDSFHTCDPNVVSDGSGKIYLYYGGACDCSFFTSRNCHNICNEAALGGTAIGVAESTDNGYTFTRLNNGLPIVRGAMITRDSLYGAGQPSVVFKDGMFWMLYTDTTGRSSSRGGGIYCIRSTSPLFPPLQTEQWTPTGFVPYNASTVTDHLFLGFDGAGPEWQFVDQFDVWIFNYGSVFIINANLTQIITSITVPDTQTTEEYALTGTPDKHSLCNYTSPLYIPIDAIRSVGTPVHPETWKLASEGFDLIQNPFDANASVVSPYCWNNNTAPKQTGSSIIGVMDIPHQPDYLNGWACVVGSLVPIAVDVYFGGPKATPQSHFVGSWSSNAPSESAVSQSCQTTGLHYRFHIPISAFASQLQPIYIYGSALGISQLLVNSGLYYHGSTIVGS